MPRPRVPGDQWQTVTNLRHLWRYHGYFFAPDTLRFWRSRVDTWAVLTAAGDVAYFVTSERPDPARPRMYRVRRMTHCPGAGTAGGDADILTMGDDYATKRAAVTARDRLAMEGSAEG